MKDRSRAFDPKKLRRRILQMSYGGQTVHVPCAFSIVEILTSLYRNHLRFDPRDPSSPERDFFALSKGHGVMALYACLEEIGWIQPEELDRYGQNGTRLPGLSDCMVPGVEVSGGSLGHGLPIAVGIAFGLQRRHEMSRKVYCLVGDGELNEGSNWESLLFAAQHNLYNLCLIVDRNRFQALGSTREILELDPLDKKLEAFGLHTFECDGHDLLALDRALGTASSTPKAVIARTIKGKGVSFMESCNEWHYTRLDETRFKQAMLELDANA